MASGDVTLLTGRKRKKMFCDHCDEYVSRATLHRHRKLSAAKIVEVDSDDSSDCDERDDDTVQAEPLYTGFEDNVATERDVSSSESEGDVYYNILSTQGCQ